MKPGQLSCEQCADLFNSQAKATPCFRCPKPELDPRNAWIWECFLALASQANVGGMGGVVGFNYAALPVIFAAKGIPFALWGYFVEKLEVITPIALRYWNDKNRS